MTAIPWRWKRANNPKFAEQTRVLLAEDSPTTREFLASILQADPGIELVGQARDGREAADLTKELTPDVVVMDITMPVMDGFEATQEIMTDSPTPIIIVSGNLDVYESAVSGHALRAGAVAVLPKPESLDTREAAADRLQFVSTVKAMGRVKVARRWHKRPGSTIAGTATRVVGVATSMGGPAALHQVVSGLPAHFAAPVLVVLRMAPGFVNELAAALDMTSIVRVKVAEHNEPLLPQTVYLAPDDCHLGLAGRERIALSDAMPIDGSRPSATFLFESMAREFGAEAAALILTGKGTDGMRGLAAIRQAGGRILAQDAETSTAFETASAATDAGLVDLALPLISISGALVSMVRGRPASRTPAGGSV